MRNKKKVEPIPVKIFNSKKTSEKNKLGLKSSKLGQLITFRIRPEILGQLHELQKRLKQRSGIKFTRIDTLSLAITFSNSRIEKELLDFYISDKKD